MHKLLKGFEKKLTEFDNIHIESLYKKESAGNIS